MDADKPSLVGIYGGTFDPIHFGHLRVAEELIDSINLQHIIFVPSGEPRLRGAPIGTRHQRTEMIRLAIQNNHRFSIDEREINRPGISTTVESLREFQRESVDNRILCFILGIDAFIKINQWHQWREIFNLCHLLVVARPGYDAIYDNQTVPQEVVQEFMLRRTISVNYLTQQSAGLIYIAQTSLLEISASQIRHLVSVDKSVRYLLPDRVSDYISTNHIYTERI
ncbi:nicotinate-nucleotide adenylyltransferase [Nitrosomonas sp. PY1]|uniref:nicotinate-nucleotide adenylyltransferase n=1 Tax=Nitrosomonas sp. PY1 TaxID=1803906 RepID=UPI001FC8A9B9|nr:nicotinate-nucleotide adenylyltransferase [Nitrosomonas sp. PY1]GKS69407.1 nicotinate-nucleotide adenylyltransferase [Nitrosomonas sp. PY1]